MRPNVFDVLLYMFEHYEELPQEPDSLDQEPVAGSGAALTSEDPLEVALASEGFGQPEIHKAFQWLGDLADQVDPKGDQSQGYELLVGRNSIRVLSSQEQTMLSSECINFLMYLHNSGVLDAAQRELILDRALALEVPLLSLEQFQWLILMVLANQPSQADACLMLEELIFDDQGSLPN